MIGFSLAEDSTGFLILSVAVASVSGLLGFVPGFLDRVTEWFTTQAAFHEKSLTELKDDLSEELAKLEAPVVIFLDDVDRLTDAEIKVLFQLVKANCQFPNLIYVVLFERDIVEAALSKIVSKGGKRYLRKIIQHSFDLPEPSPSRLRHIVATEIDRILFKSDIKGLRFDSDRWQSDFADVFFRWFPTIRDAKRFFGSFRFVLSRQSAGGVLEVDPIDLLIIEGLRTFNHDVYQRVAEGFHSRGGFEGIFGGRDELKNAFREQVDTIVEACAEEPEERTRVRKILVGLFPQAAEHSYYAEGSEEKWLGDRRVCHRKHFKKYFQLALDEGDISAVTLDRIIAKSGEREELVSIFNGAKKDGRILDLMESVFVIRDQIASENLTALVTALFDIGDDLPEDADAFLLADAEMTCLRIVHHRLKGERPDKTIEILKGAYNDTSGVILPVRFLALEDEESRERKAGEREFLIPEDQLPEFQEIVLGLIKQRADSSLLDLRRCSAILYRWKDWESESAVQEWTAKVIEKPDDALKLLMRLLSATYSDGRLKEHWLNGKSIESLVDLDKLLESVRKLDPSSLEEEEIKAIKLLELAVERRSKGMSYEEVRLGRDTW